MIAPGYPKDTKQIISHFMTYQSAAHRSQKSRPPAASTQKSAAANATKAHLKKQLRAGRPKHRQIALHPLSILLLLAAGVCIICWTGRVIADNFNVTAVVPAKPLTKPATIRSLADGAVITQLPVTVSGFCPTDSYVKLYANNTFSGAALCLGSETYSIETSLFPGSNRLLVQAYNTTDEPGPVGQAITVQYNPKQPQATSTPSSRPLTGSSAISATSASSLQLLLTSDFHYQTFVTGDTFSWPMDLEGGTPPYTVYITWGDGQSSTIVFKADPVFQITHHFSKQGYYPVVVRSVDATGQVQVIQLSALIRTAGSSGILPASGTQSGAAPANHVGGISTALLHAKRWLWLAWPSFVILLLMVASFWLGERKEYGLMLRDLKTKKRTLRHGRGAVSR